MRSGWNVLGSCTGIRLFEGRNVFNSPIALTLTTCSSLGHVIPTKIGWCVCVLEGMPNRGGGFQSVRIAHDHMCKGRSNNGPARRGRALRSSVDAQRFCPPKCQGKMSSM